MMKYKHVDFQIPLWREFKAGPTVSIKQSFRPVGYRAYGFRPKELRPTAGSGGVAAK
jgi:hypothetical protein